jgi:uncharacterized protein (DUF58 family)
MADKTEPARAANAIDPRLLAETGNLSMKARILAESALTGMHRSRHHGSSVEFAEHKEYSPGDNVRHLDWRAYARLDRDYIKRFEDESNLRALMLVDTSGSMGYRGPGNEAGLTKHQYAVNCAAALAYVLARQGDAVGLATFSEKLEMRVPPRARRGHLQEIFVNLERLAPSGSTRLADALDALAEGLSRRMIVVVFSDLLDAGEGAMEAITRVAARRHDVALFHLMDPDELDFPFEDSTLFTSMEDDREVPIDARAIREAYLEEVRRFTSRVEAQARSARVEYQLVRTDAPPNSVLARFLSLRGSARHSAR